MNGARITVTDGPNAGKSATVDGAGNYAITGLQSSGFTARAAAKWHNEQSKPVTLNNSNQTLDFQLSATPLFSRSGTGDTVFDMPTTVERVKITAHLGKEGQNFIVHIAGDHVVNELVGPWYDQVDFSGTYVTNGGVVEILSSSGVKWTFTEVR
jgi:hypothetical protein